MFDMFSEFGMLSGILFETGIVTFLGFFISALLISFYTKKFYAVGEMPQGWKFFYWGLMLNGIYQMFKVPFTYNLIGGYMPTVIFLVFQVFATAVLAYGLYLLLKEVQI